MFLTENQLDAWVRASSKEAQGVIVELLWRLVAASSPRPKERRFPLGDSIGQHGPDGVLDTDVPFEPFVPEGRSFWEVGTGTKAGGKATDDYNGLVADLPELTRRNSTFVFVTPLSAARDWQHTWKPDAQGAWLDERKSKGDWKDVRIIDGTKLIEWLHHFPVVSMWLAQRTLGLPAGQIQSIEQHWKLLSSIGEPPPLAAGVFLANREEARSKLAEIFSDTAIQLRLATRSPDQAADFVSACVAELDPEERADVAGRCVVLSGAEAWQIMASQREKHILVADASLDLAGVSGTRMIQTARRNGHAIVFGGPPGGIPEPGTVSLLAPRIQQLQDALQTSGYREERARILANKSGGNLGSLLRCLQNLSIMPEWAEESATADLAVANLLGSWSDQAEADQEIVEHLSGKAFGEWIGPIREVALRPGTPLLHRDGIWKFISRYDAWYSLGPRIFPDQLDRLKESALAVLSEIDPQFELPAGERYAARMYGKSPVHSSAIRTGLTDTLALLGSHPGALTSCPVGKADGTAAIVVRTLLSKATWVNWANLNDLLPLLAEASPREFLDAVERDVAAEQSPFVEVFGQEGDGITGRNYMTGLLWALETLAWEPENLNRVVVCLGELASHDPGGRWANRPINSLTTILLPWLPQTTATIEQRAKAAELILNEVPGAGWKLLLSLLPQSHSSSTGSRRPAWRESIPDTWSNSVSNADYWKQIKLYSQMAVTAARADHERLRGLIDHMDNLPEEAFDTLLDHIESEALATTAESDRLSIWTELTDLANRHRRFADAQWAMPSGLVDRIERAANKIAPVTPNIRHQRLFNERDHNLFDEKDSYEVQIKKLEDLRAGAIQEIFGDGGTGAVVNFAQSVSSPSRAGASFGASSDAVVDSEILPDLLTTEDPKMAQFIGGYVWGAFRNRGWKWVDEIDTSAWTKSQAGKFYSFLPFTPEAWDRAEARLKSDLSAYWSIANVNPYQPDSRLEFAVERLLDHSRPFAAIGCLYKMLHNKEKPKTHLAARALLAALKSEESTSVTDGHEIVDVIKYLQTSTETSDDDLFHVEWSYLFLLNEHHGASPEFLGKRLATDPKFFCEVIRAVYKSRHEASPEREPTEAERNIASNGYKLLREWRIPPGTTIPVGVDANALETWLASVKAECSASGHIEAAMTCLGHVMVYSPPDPDGLWIDRSIASVMNAKDLADARDGFRVEMFNQRGVHGFSAGKEERLLAQKYNKMADSLDAATFHRFAGTLRELSESYMRDAEREANKDRFED